MMTQKIYALFCIVIINVIASIQGMEQEKNKLIQVMPIVQKLFDDKVIERFPCHSPNEINLNIFFTLRNKKGIIEQSGVLLSLLEEKELIDLIKSIKGFFSLMKEPSKNGKSTKNVNSLTILTNDSERLCNMSQNNNVSIPEKQKDLPDDNVVVLSKDTFFLKEKPYEGDKSINSRELLTSSNKINSKISRKMSQSSDAVMSSIYEEEDEQKKPEIIVGSVVIPSSPSIIIAKKVKRKDRVVLPESDDESQKDNKNKAILPQDDDIFDMEL